MVAEVELARQLLRQASGAIIVSTSAADTAMTRPARSLHATWWSKSKRKTAARGTRQSQIGLFEQRV
jgi:hypothetical protein